MVENDDKTARISQLESFVADMKEIIAQSAQLEALQRKEKKKGLGGGLGRFFGRIFDKSDWGYEATDLEVTIRTLRIAQLEAFVADIKKTIDKKNSELDRYRAENSEKTAQIAQLESSITDMQKTIDKKNRELDRYRAENNEKTARIAQLESSITDMQKTIDKKNRELDRYRAENNEKTARIAQLESSITDMQKTIDKKNRELDRYKLVSDALQAKQKPEQIEAVKEFQRLFKEEFLKFADEESSLADEASVVLHLQEVQHKMERIAAFPELEVKTMGAIGGGFSSGKSSFINSFITVPNIRLAEGIKPVTVIPSYVTYSEKVEIRGSTQNGASFLIDKDTYKSISHELLQDLSFDLKQVIPYMTVSCPMDKNLFGNICLIDTPGYNAPVVGFAGSDEETAFNYIKDAGFLIWLVGVDASGVISKSDFEFLKKLDFGKDREKELYVVINKAELRKESDRESLLDTAADFLADNDVTYTGICAYSSRKKQMFSHRKMKLEDFLQKKNKPGRAINQLDNAIDEVFNRYKSALTDDRDNTSSRRKQFMSLQNYISIISLDVEDTDKIDKIDEYLSSIIRELTTDEFDKHLETCEKLRKKFKLCVVDFCDKLGIKQDATHGTGRYKETLQQMAVILSGAIKNSGGDPENMMSSQTKP